MDVSKTVRFIATEIPLYFEYDGEATGRATDFFLTFIRNYNLRYNLTMVGTINYGKVTSPTDGTGAIGYLVRNESDICPNAMDPTKEIVEYLDYTSCVAQEGWYIISRPSDLLSANYFAILNIFESQLWYATLVSAFLLGLFATIIRVYDGRTHFRLSTHSLVKTTLEVFAVFFNQGKNNWTGSFPTRILWIAWILGAFLLTSSYTGKLLSTMTLPDSPFVFDKLGDFLDHPETKLVVFKTSPVAQYLESSKDADMMKLWKRIQDEGTEMELLDSDFFSLIQDVIDRKLAFLLTKEITKEIVKYVCGFGDQAYFSKEPPTSTRFVFLFRKNLNKKLKTAYKRMALGYSEFGIFKYLDNKATWLGSLCLIKDNIQENETMTLKHFYFIYIWLLFGLSISIIYFISETINNQM